MPNELIGVVGKPLLISHVVSADTAFAVNNALITIWSSAGTAVLTNQVAEAEPSYGTEALEHQLSYLWSNPATADDYRYLLVPDDSLSDPIPGVILIWPTTSLLDRYIVRVRGWLQDPQAGEDQRSLSLRDYRDGLKAAVDAFSVGTVDEKTGKLHGANPRRVVATVSLSAGVWQYNLSSLTSYESRFSRFVRLEYPVDVTAQTKYLLGREDWEELPDEGVWRFKNAVPVAGEQAAITYTARHSLTHTQDTLPTYAFESVCQYAAGLLVAGPQANEYLRTSAPEIAAGMISYEPRSRSANSYGQTLMEQARTAWETFAAGTLRPRSRAWTAHVGCR